MTEGTEDEENSEDSSPLVQAYIRSSARGRDAGNQWLRAEIDYATRRNDVPRLLGLCTGEPEPFREREDAALLVCRGLLMEGRGLDFQSIRDQWRGREKRTAAWLALDADALLEEGKKSEARALLLEKNLPGREDAIRLARLALTADDRAEAFELLDRAAALTPGAADVHDCRGRLLESLARYQEAAREFATALSASGNDWIIRDRLAECYRRVGDIESATTTWLPSSQSDSVDFAWVKAWFWNRVARPVARDWEETAPEFGRLRRLADFLIELPPEAFWLTDREQGQIGREPVVHRQETFWLRILALLKSGREREGQRQLRAGPYRHFVRERELQEALDCVLSFRTGQPVSLCSVSNDPASHPFFRQLASLAADGKLQQGATDLPEDIARLLRSEDAVAATFLAAGWDEAALILHDSSVDLSVLPAWYAEGIIRARWRNHGSEAALESLRRQPRSAVLDLVAGELLTECGRGSEGLERLRSAMAVETTGARAAKVFALEALREGKASDARRAVESFPSLTQDKDGELLLARCLAAEGNEDRAEQLYRELAADSAEARRYLIHRALKGGDWNTARDLAGATGR
jgi:tetratricopeptide (TPR) repeat protein